MSWTAQAEVLADTSEVGANGAMMCGRCRATGLDVRSFSHLIGATLALGSRPLVEQGWTPYPNDRSLVYDLCDLAGMVANWQEAVVKLIRTAVRRRSNLRRWLAVSEGAGPVEAWRREIADCNTALEILAPVPRRLRAAASRLNATPAQLGDTYAAAYRLVEAGRVLPYDGRWITGEGTTS